jgi:superfamily II DNA or RNA helicase
LELFHELEEFGIEIHFTDKTFCGNKIDVEFKGQLRDEQTLARNCLLQHNTGILSGTTAFGKTIVAIKLIAKKSEHAHPR